MAELINSTFATFDYNILAFFHGLVENYGNVLTPIANVLAVIGDKLNLLIFIGLILVIFTKNKKMGVLIIFSIAVGVVICSVIFKNIVARPRPFNANETFNAWWQFAGSSFEDSYSFPSGHTNAAMAGITAIFIMSKNKKVSWLLYLYVVIMGASRNYLCVHYPSDVLFGVVTGFISAVVAYYLLNYLLKKFGDKLPFEIK